MISSQDLRNALEYAISESANTDSSCTKSVFLDVLFGRIANTLPDEQSSDRLRMLLNKRSELPVQHSRLEASDLQRRVQCISWGKLGHAIDEIGELVWEATTVSAGDCEECMGEELVFLWDIDKEKLVRQCDLCGSTLDLAGSKVTSSPHLVVPTHKQLVAVGVIDSGIEN